ncbi:ABC transporter ATP-binding protein [Paenibacillus sp. A3]|nr:ABC transporter ATP-binding protein [Paenibacillus sp. A3]
MRMIIQLLKQNKLLNTMLIAASIIFGSLLLILTININQTNIEVGVTNNFKGKNLYQISDNLYNEKEKEFFSNPNSIKILNDFSKRVNAVSAFKYYNGVEQPIDIANFEGDPIFDAYYESGGNQPARKIGNKSYRFIKSVQLNQTVFDLNQIQLSQGEAFKEDAYVFNANKDTIPIIIGSDYNGVYKVGDTLDILYYWKPFIGVVVGILEPSQKVLKVGSEPELLLNRYMILPMLQFEQSPPKMDGIFLKALLLSKVNGKIVTELTPIQVRNTLEDIGDKTGFHDFAVIGASGIAIDSIISFTEINRNLLMVFSLVLFATVIILFVVITRITINKNIDIYKVLLISGISMEQMVRIVKRQAILLQLIGYIPPLLLLALTLKDPLFIIVNYVVAVGISILIMWFVIGRYTQKYFDKLDIVQQLKG